MNASDTAPAADEQHDHTTQQPAGQADAQAGATQDQTGSEQAGSEQAGSDRTGYGPRYDYSQGEAPLYRPYRGRMAAGVAAGIAQYLGVDPTIVRIVLAALTVVGGAGIPIYVAGWLLIPDEGAPQSLASELIGSLQGRSC